MQACKLYGLMSVGKDNKLGFIHPGDPTPMVLVIGSKSV